MNVARVLYPVRVLGPGRRVGLWLCGCQRACPGCSNPELWARRPENEVDVDEVLRLIRRLAAAHPVDGFTVTGGEPMLQAAELARLVSELRDISRDILVYTGFTLEELREMRDEATAHVLQNIAVLIDGPYIEEKNDGSPLRGSANQRIHVLDEAFAGRYADFFKGAHNQIQNFTTRDGVVSVGIHRPGF